MYSLLRHTSLSHATMRPFLIDTRASLNLKMSKLAVYIEDSCWTCAESRRIVGLVAPLVPTVEIELRDLSDERRPPSVFASPTYVLDGQVIFLGNPTVEELVEKLNGKKGTRDVAERPLRVRGSGIRGEDNT